MSTVAKKKAKFVDEDGKKMTTFGVVGFFILLAVSIIMLMPMIFMISTSLKTQTELLRFPPTIIPDNVIFRNYVDIFSELENFFMYYMNSLRITVLCVIGVTVTSAFVAYGFSRYEARSKKFLFMILVSTLLLPAPALIIPQYLVFQKVGWVDTILPLVVPSFFGAAYDIFLLRQFFSTLTEDLFDAARIDGCSEIRTWWNIALPLCGPALATVAIFTFLWNWNDLINPVIYINTEEKKTLTLGLSSLVVQRRLIPWHYIMTGNIYMIVPVVIIFYVSQRYFVEGIAITGIK